MNSIQNYGNIGYQTNFKNTKSRTVYKLFNGIKIRSPKLPVTDEFADNKAAETKILDMLQAGLLLPSEAATLLRARF